MDLDYSVDSKTGIGVLTLEDKSFPVITLEINDKFLNDHMFITKNIFSTYSIEDLYSESYKIDNDFKCSVLYKDNNIHVRVESIKRNKDCELLASIIPKFMMNDKIFIQYADIENTISLYQNVKRFIDLYNNYGCYFIFVKTENPIIYCSKEILLNVDLYNMGMDLVIHSLQDDKNNYVTDKNDIFYSWEKKFNKNLAQKNYLEVKKTVLSLCNYIKKKRLYRKFFLYNNFMLYGCVYTFLFRDGLLVGLDGDDPLVFNLDVFDLIFSDIKSFLTIQSFYYSYVYYNKDDYECIKKIGCESLIKIKDIEFDIKNVVNEALNNRKYVLNSDGIRVKISDEYIKEILIKETEKMIKGYIVTKSGNYFPIIYDYDNYIGFSFIDKVEDEIINNYYMRRFIECWYDLIAVKRYSKNKRSNKESVLIKREDSDEIKKDTVIYLPIKIYGDKQKDFIRQIKERKSPVAHEVSGHLRKAKKASQKQIELAKSYGIELPEGYTFVRPFKKGD